MNLPFFIAGRYLFARKSHNVINVISAISAAGMAVGTAALILILSVYNGFDGIIKDNLSDIDPDLRIELTRGRHFNVDSCGIAAHLYEDERIESICPVLEEKVFLTYGQKQSIVTAKGVEDDYPEATELERHIGDGIPVLHRGDIPQACVGSALAYDMNIRPWFNEPLVLYYPDRNKNISPSNPAAALGKEKVFPAGIFSISADIDKNLILVPLETMQSLTGLYESDEVSGLELRLRDSFDSNMRRLKAELSEKLGESYTVLDRYDLHPALYRMMKLEKAAIFLILLFVVVIVAFNIFGSMSMLIIEKKEDISTLSALGASNTVIRRIFFVEGWLVSLIGLGIGLLLGIGLCILQQKFGLVKMPGNFLITAYPVELQAADVILTAAGVTLIGLLISLISTHSLKNGLCKD